MLATWSFRGSALEQSISQSVSQPLTHSLTHSLSRSFGQSVSQPPERPEDLRLDDTRKHPEMSAVTAEPRLVSPIVAWLGYDCQMNRGKGKIEPHCDQSKIR